MNLQPAGARHAAVFANLMQLYLHDFSEFSAATGALGEDGRFAPYAPMPLYWQQDAAAEGREALLIRQDSELAGFALINRHTHSGEPADFNMAEFFIVRRHRRGGLGSAAAQALFAARPGQWEVAVMRANRGALPFWRRAVGGTPGCRALQEQDVRSEQWDGVLFRFRMEQASPTC